MARWKPFILGLLLAGALFRSLAAGDRSVTLEDAVARALNSHPAVLGAQKAVDAARGRRLQLEAVPNPELSFEAAGLPLWDSSAEREFSLGVRQRIEFPGKRGLRRDIGRSGEHQAALELQRIRNVVRGRVETAYFRAAYAQGRVADLESVLGTLKDYLELAAERYKTGQVPYLDVVRGRLESLRVQNEIVEARRDLKEKTMALALLMGDTAYEPMEFSTGMEFSPLGRSFEDLKEAALAGSTLRLAAARQKQAGLSISLARKSGLPDFALGLFTPSKKLGAWGFEVGLTLPLFRKEFRGATIEAEAAHDQAVIDAQGKTRRVLLILERSYADVQALEEQIGLFRDSLIREVEESLKAGLINYQYGKSDALGVLDIVRSLKETRAEFLRALLNHRLALIEIAAAGEDEDIGIGNGE
jgi:cobalt-zinc-cadmium efflux system outer membrane protein